jgi:hypothetical protein
VVKDLQSIIVASVTPKIEDLYRTFASKLAVEEAEPGKKTKGDEKEDEREKDKKKKKDKKVVI